jgi:hypothetical protein
MSIIVSTHDFVMINYVSRAFGASLSIAVVTRAGG